MLIELRMKYTNENFETLDFNLRSAIIEQILLDDYFSGQVEIDFWLPPDYDGESEDPLPPTPPEIQAEEDRKMELLVSKLQSKLFTIYKAIEFTDTGDLYTIGVTKDYVGNIEFED